VKDTGIGIPSCDIGKLFRLFGKLEGYEGLNPQGCGLGLSISNHIVESLSGGHISVQSTVGKGSIFAFDVDLGFAALYKDPIMADPTTDVDDESPLLKNRLRFSFENTQRNCVADILIVDDSDFNRIVARRIIETQGFVCEEAVTGLQALNRVRELLGAGKMYKLILMDIEMPEMDGVTATREIRSLFRPHEQPVIVGCSAYSSPEDREVSLAAGMNYYLEKPMQREQLISLLAPFAV
jgi:CheY-like chemotaxis protein